MSIIYDSSISKKSYVAKMEMNRNLWIRKVLKSRPGESHREGRSFCVSLPGP